jgi:tyrosyl-tRNA synthetase
MAAKKSAQKIITDPEVITDVLARGVAEVIQKDSLLKKLQSGKPLRIKLGIDPTGAHLHIGHANTLLKLRDFQNLGHTAVLIIGDATGRIGDTSDKDSERPMLQKKILLQNETTYLAQVGRILDMKKTEVHHNSKWLDKLDFAEIGEQAEQFSVADFIARDNIKRRLVSGRRVSLREMLYPIMQGYDSVAVKADVELGGTDQRFNLLAGRTLQTHYKQDSQDVVMMHLLPGTDGRKMSKSLGNTINILDIPNTMYANVMRVHDSLVAQYFEMCTRMPKENVSQALTLSPKEAKMRLAREIVTLYHGDIDAQKAEEEFIRVFSNKELPENIKEAVVPNQTSLEDVLVREGMAPSKSEVRRLIEGGGLRDAQTGEKISDPKVIVSKPIILKIGKKKFLKIILKFKKRDDKK